LAIYVGRRFNSNQVIEVLADAMIAHGIPESIRSDNGQEFVARLLRMFAWNHPRRPLSGHFTCYDHRTHHLLTTLQQKRVDTLRLILLA
jgi:hypothetical protein